MTICNRCGATAPAARYEDVVVPDEYGVACSEPGVPTTMVMSLPVCQACLDEEEAAAHDEGALCASCAGSGEGSYDGSTCRTCRGSGVVGPRDRDDGPDEPDEPEPPEWYDGTGGL